MSKDGGWTPMPQQYLADQTFGPLHLYEAANDNAPRVIGLSGVAGSGKSTAADYLVRMHGYERVKFAGPLKDMMRAIGLSEYAIEGDGKEQPYPELLCGKTPRHAMQTLGTEWGRNCMGVNFWVGLWTSRALDVLDAGGRVVADDVRFANESDAIHKLGGVVVRLVGRGGVSGGHVSESMNWEADKLIQNIDSREVLYSSLYQLAA